MRKRKISKAENRRLSVQQLEPRLALASSAFLGVVAEVVVPAPPPGTPVNILVLGEGEDNRDVFTLETLDAASGFSGHVLVKITDVDVPGGQLIGAYAVPQLQAIAAPGKFLGFKMDGKAGNDKLDASLLKNLETTTLVGGLGDDELIGGKLSRDRFDAGVTVIPADTSDNDTVKGADCYDTTSNPSTPYGAFTPFIQGGLGSDKITFSTDPACGISWSAPNMGGFETISGTDGADNIDVSTEGGDHTIDGLGGDDTIKGGSGKDTINGGEGKDTIFGLGGEDTLSGGGGDDTVYGGDNNDTINGNDGNDTLKGDGGDDNVDGGLGNDGLFGGDGNDTLKGADGDDVLTGDKGNDNLDGGTGSDTINYDTGAETTGIDVELAKGKTNNDGQGGTDTLSNIENVNGSAKADSIIGDGAGNLIKGNGGNDSLRGGGGDDTLTGDDGEDTIDGEDGNDTVLGGNDNDKILGGEGNDVLSGDDGSDTIYGERGNDQLAGGNGEDILDGGLGADVMTAIGPLGYDTATDQIFHNYDRTLGGIEDLVSIGGTAWTDKFWVKRIKFDNTSTDPFAVQQVIDGALTPTEQFDAQYEMKYPVGSPQDNLIGARILVFSDFDGGDGPTGDQLLF